MILKTICLAHLIQFVSRTFTFLSSRYTLIKGQEYEDASKLATFAWIWKNISMNRYSHIYVP